MQGVPCELVGKRFGNLVVLSLAQSEKTRRRRLWLCQCDCGNTRTADSDRLTRLSVTNCGCAYKYQRKPCPGCGREIGAKTVRCKRCYDKSIFISPLGKEGFNALQRWLVQEESRID